MKEKELKEQDNLSGREEKESKNKNILVPGAIGLTIGLIIGATLIYLLGMFNILGIGDEKVATFKGGNVSKNEIYNELEVYTLSYALEIADKEILDSIYELTEEQKQEVTQEADSILTMYQMYGYTDETFLSENGFDSKEDFVNYMEFDYKRNLACLDYFKTLIPTEDIENYYNENVKFGEINTKHILAQVSDDVTEEQALATANEIITKLKQGTSFDDVVTEYGDKVISEKVDFDSFTASTLAETYVEASKKLEKDTYTTEAVKTNYGYHIIYCVDKAEKPSLSEVENDIVELLGENLEAEDEYIRYKALIKLREDNNLKFKNKKLEEEYVKYCEEVNETTEQ